jgi:hypothetical protein
MDRRRAAALMMVGLLGLSPALAGCDKEDQRDIQEGVNEVEEGAEEVGEEIEKGIDENVDTDGKDD